MDAAADIALYEDEAAAFAGVPKRAAPLVHEAAHVRERFLGFEREAARSYATSLTLDPSFAPNAWALRRVFVRRGFWDNLLRVLDAEIRFAPWARPADRADLQVERGRLLEDRLGRDDEAAESYKAALGTAADHPGALWSLLFLGWRTGRGPETEAALVGLLGHTEEPLGLSLLSLSQARVQRGRSKAAADPDAWGHAAETLFRALSGGAEPGPLLRELDRLSLLADKVDLRLRFLDAFESRVVRDALQHASNGHLTARDPALAAIIGNHREKARILLRRGARDAALAVLERTLRVAPAHPIVLLDFLDAAEEAGRADAIEAMLEGPLADLPATAQAEALLRRAELVEKAGALGEAIGMLDRIPAESPYAPLAALARLRVLARLQDAEGLARAFTETAERLVDGDEGQRREAAHLFVRAATARHRALDDVAGAEELLRRALAVQPGYGPAAAGLAAALAHSARYADLATFVETQAGPQGTLARPLREALVVLHRDILGDGVEALRHQRALLAERDDERAHARTVDVAGMAPSPESIGVALQSLSWLAERLPPGTVAASLRILAARLSARSSDPGQAEALLRHAVTDDPSSTAGAALERLLHAAGREDERLAVLRAELRAAEQSGRSEAARALRFRLAFAWAGAGKVADAIGQLEPLRRNGDRLAAAWSLDLARRGGDARAEVTLLRELSESGGMEGEGGGTELGSAFERTWALGEALEQVGERAGAAEAFKEASTRSADADPVRWADVELGVFRSHVAEGQIGEAAASLRGLALFVEGDATVAVRREAGLLALSAGLPDQEEPSDGAADGVWRWLRGVRAGDDAAVASGLEQLARHAPASAASASLWTAVAIHRAAAADERAPASLEEAARAATAAPGEGGSNAAATLALAATDLVPPGPLAPALRDLRRARAARLAEGTESQRRLAEALRLEDALEAESAGQLGEAAAAYAALLAQRPDSLEATEGLRRLAEVVGDRRAQAAALARQGALCRSPRRASEAYAEAALLLEEEGLEGEAAQLFLEVLARIPGDDEAYHRLHAILSRREDAPGLERLLTYKIQQTSEPARRVRLYEERARLRLAAGADRKGGIEDLRRILQLDAHHAESLRTLGRLALEDGRFAVAARYLDSALAQERDAEAATNLRLQLGEAYEGAGDLPSAIRVLTAAADARPDDPQPRERLIALGVRRRDYVLALAQLAALEAAATTPAERAAVIIRVGRLERDSRHDPQRALTAFRAALMLDPLGEAAGELASVVPVGAVLEGEDQAAISAVVSDLRQTLLDTDPLDVRRLERLRDLARLRGLGELAEVARQLLGALGVVTERARSRELSRPLSLAGVVGLMAGPEGSAGGLVTELWPLIGEGAARMEGLEPSQLGASRHNRIPPAGEPRLHWLEAAAHSIGLSQLTIYVAGPDNLSVTPLDAPEPSLVVGNGVLAGDAASRFRAGRALFVLRQRAAVVVRLPPEAIDEVLQAAAVLTGARVPGMDNPALRARAKALSKALPRKELRALEAFRPRVESERLDPTSWLAAVRRGADRFGLLVAGDLAACLRVMTGVGEPTTAELRRPPTLELIRFALDDRYAALRRDVGVSAGER
jgi:tetratricopeptide (TPR) repeat protein